ncbi:MAG TPA: tyrosine-type recombinase/integrase [Candidatus Acidoferrum sp.]
MAEITGEGYLSNKINHAGTYYMFLTIDGVKTRRTTGTKDQVEAAEKLEQWKLEVKAGVKEESRLRYEKLRDTYLESGKHVQGSILEDLNIYFRNIYVRSITTTALKAFRKFRENNTEVLKYKELSYQQEIAVRKLALGRKPNPKELAVIESGAREWVENATKATTNRRLTVLRAMFNHAVKEELISKHDVPYFPMAAGADNIRRTTVSDELFANILNEIPETLHPYIKFLAATGKRSGQAARLTWDELNAERTVLAPKSKTGTTKRDASIILVDSKGNAFEWSEWIVKKGVRINGTPIFDITDFRSRWRLACHKLKVGVYDKKKHTYRGLKPHDFRRTAISNMTAKGIGKGAAKSISGHKTDSIFNRYDIKDLKDQQGAFEIMAGK